MIKKLLFSTVFLAMAFANTHANMAKSDKYFEELMQSITQKYITGAVVTSWLDNWYVNVAGGGSAFIGSPIGCEDFFGRIKPTLQISIGKWHTPTVGNRIVFQGFKLKSGELQTQNYRHYHADLLLNITPMLSRFDIIPLVGVGIIDNRSADTRPFSINYGVQGRYCLTDYFHITAELSNATTFKDADGFGDSRQFGDHNLNLVAGVAWTFGRNVGWKKVADSTPYIQQNERLSAYAYSLRQRNNELERAYNDNTRIIAELRKILDIEGLLDKYSECFENHSELNVGRPINDYSGLNSLRKRLSGEKNGNKNVGKKFSAASKSAKLLNGSDSIYFDVSDGLGAPIFFFFELGTSDLVDNSQLVNLNEIARIAIKYGLKIDVVGAADSMTGTEEINDNLGVARSQYIAEYLTAKGVLAENIAVHSKGGIGLYTPNAANRNATVRLSTP